MPASRRTLESAFGDILRDLRLKEGLSQEALAHACDRHPTFISLLERGRNSPSLATVFLLAKGLGIKPSELVRRVEAKLRR